MRLGWARALVVGWFGVCATAEPLGFEGAKWIWFSQEPMPISQSFPAGPNWFRARIELPGAGRIVSGELLIAADNLYTLYVNGRLAGESEPQPDAWNRAKRFDVTSLLVAGANLIAVEAINTAPGPAGLLVKGAVRLAEGQLISWVSDESWRCLDVEVADWAQGAGDDGAWRAAHVVGEYGVAPWGRIVAGSEAVRAGRPVDGARRAVHEALAQHKVAALLGGRPVPRPVQEVTPAADYPWPEAIVFLGEDCSLYRPPSHTGTSQDSLTVTIFNPHHSRAFPEHDLPAPVKVGRKLYVLDPARPGTPPRVLLDAGAGAIGSPSVAFDGRSILVSMVRAGGAFFHIYRWSAASGELEQLTDGPFHDIDPAELPDGRIVFASTRIGRFEEYHNPPSRALFVMNAAGGEIRPLTHTFIFDNEPEVMADGRILFIRSDNFFDRGKVETLLHALHPDGTIGYTEFGLDLGPEYGNRLRAFNCGSPAPLPDGRVAFATGSSIVVGRPGFAPAHWLSLPLQAGDVAALPDGRLLCTLPRPISAADLASRRARPAHEFQFARLALVDPDGGGDQVVRLYAAEEGAIHSPVYWGPRVRPPVLPQQVARDQEEHPEATGVFFCQDVRLTKNTTAGWDQVRAVRVLAGQGLTVRSSHSYIVHAGSEVIELGTVPLAPDGSFAVEVPANTAIAFQAVDAEGRSELNEMSWIYVRPGENRGCVGCHHPRQGAPVAALPVIQALQSRPLKLVGQGRPHRFRGNNAAVTGLMELQFDRYREVAGINRYAEGADSLATRAQHVAAATSELQDLEAGVRLAAAQRLALFRDRMAAPALVERLHDSSREVRVAVALALAACGTRDSVPPLLDALTDVEPLVGQAAAVAIENLTGHRPSFDPFTESSERRRQAERWRAWFAGTDWDVIEAALVRRMESRDRGVVRRAAVALGHVGGASARAALREFVSREREHNPYPEWRKTHQGDGAMFNALSEANPRTLQAATRALGYLQDSEAVPLLADTLERYANPPGGNLFLAEAAAEALGWIATPGAATATARAFTRLTDYFQHTAWYGDHDALIACHAAPVHFYLLEGLDASGSLEGRNLVAHLVRSLPTDPDRALLLGNDDYEVLVGRVLRRAGAEARVVETCLAILGDPGAARDPEVAQAIAATHQAWAGKPDSENRAAQVLGLVCRERRFEPRIRAAYDRYRALPTSIPRVFDTGIPVVLALPAKHWVCFFLARALGNLAEPASADSLLAALEQSPTEAALGRPDPLGPGVLFLHNDLTPCWRAATAWALGRIGDARAVPVLLGIVRDLDNAPDTRHAAAEALGRLVDTADLAEVRLLAQTYPETSTRQALLRVTLGGEVLTAATPTRQD